MNEVKMTISEMNKMYDDMADRLKAIDDKVREYEAKAIMYIEYKKGDAGIVMDNLQNLYDCYEQEKDDCDKLPYGSKLVLNSIIEEQIRIMDLKKKLFIAMYL